MNRAPRIAALGLTAVDVLWSVSNTIGDFRNMEETLTVGGTKSDVERTGPFTVAWWESRTAEELRDIINRGFAGGQEFTGAVAEVERRARAETRRLRDLAAAEALARKKRGQMIWRSLAAALVLAALLGFWFGL